MENILSFVVNDWVETQYVDDDVIARNISKSDNSNARSPRNNPWTQGLITTDHNEGNDRSVGGSERGDSEEKELRWRVQQIPWRDWKDRKDLLPGHDQKIKKPGILIDYTTQIVGLLMPGPISCLMSWYRNDEDVGNTVETIRDGQCSRCQEITYTLIATEKKGEKRKIKADERTRDLLQVIQAKKAGCYYCMEVTKLVVEAMRLQETELEGLSEEHEWFGDMALLRPIRKIQLDAPRVVLWDRFFRVRTSAEHQYISLQKIYQHCNTKIFMDIETHLRFGFDLYIPKEKAKYGSDLSGRQIYGSPTDAGAVSLARSWLQNCRSNHRGCSPPSNDLPTRVIDVGSETRSPRLVMSQDGAPGVYAALSYCWGFGVPLVTTLKSLEARLKMIRIEDMPPTIRDAVHFARLLQIPYLWVDALCIIQDSDQDWTEQSAQMANIYSNALVTLAVLDAASTTDGFLDSRNIELPRPQIEVQVEGHYGGKGCTKRERPFLRKQYPHHDWFSRPSHLHSRAWCLQECILSERTIYFQYDQIFWQCTEAWLREGSVKPGDEATHDVATTLRMRAEHRDWREYGLRRVSCKSLDVAKASEEFYTNPYVVWRNMVKEFQTRNITRHSDRLPAMAGLASAFQRANPGEYYAGLWGRDMHHGLLWAVNPNRRGIPYRSPLGKAAPTYPSVPPSWSWAATTYHIIYPSFGLSSIRWDARTELDHELCIVEHVQTKISTANPFGQVDGGKLVLRGPFQTVSQSTINSLTNKPAHVEWWLDNGVYGRADFLKWDEFDCILIGLAKGTPMGLVLSRTLEGEYRRIGLVQFPYVKDQDLCEWQEGWNMDHSISIV